MVNNSHLLIRCSFDPAANKHTQTIFFHMTLPTGEGILYEHFGLNLLDQFLDSDEKATFTRQLIRLIIN